MINAKEPNIHKIAVLRANALGDFIFALPALNALRFAYPQADLVEAQQIVPQKKKPLIALHPGATAVHRRWPVEKFGEVGDALAAAGAHVVVTGTTSAFAIIA